MLNEMMTDIFNMSYEKEKEKEKEGEEEEKLEPQELCQCLNTTGVPINININIYKCETCEYATNRKSSYDAHVITNKHIKNDLIKKNGGVVVIKHQRKNVKRGIVYDILQTKLFNCTKCDKPYGSRNGLWKHRKMCATEINAPPKDNMQLTCAIMELIKQNQDFQKQIIEITKENKCVTNNTTHTTTSVQHNNTFNLQVFLNETCKDALNMVDFVKMMRIDLSDLETTAKLGYTDGVSRIFVNGLKELDVHKRPIHCSDFKREILYIKEDDVWAKDTEDKTLMKQAIRRVEHKNIVQIPLWIKAHPEAVKSDDKLNKQYLNIVCQSTGGDYSNIEQNINKIIRNVAKEVIISKGPPSV